ncbi:hypothetical protein ACTL6U_15495 [Rhodovibrionaceae bacterium A322]
MNTQALALVDLYNHSLFLERPSKQWDRANAVKHTDDSAVTPHEKPEKRSFLVPTLVVADWLQGLFPGTNRPAQQNF